MSHDAVTVATQLPRCSCKIKHVSLLVKGAQLILALLKADPRYPNGRTNIKTRIKPRKDEYGRVDVRSEMFALDMKKAPTAV